jgi:hypothetical protein
MINPALIMLSPKYREIARRLMAGESQATIAEGMGMSAHSLNVIINRNPLFQRAMSELNTLEDKKVFDFLAYMRTNTPEAAEVIVNILKDKEATRSERRLAAKDVLGYAGYGNPSAVQVNVNNLTFEKKIALEVSPPKAIEGEVIDGQPDAISAPGE